MLTPRLFRSSVTLAPTNFSRTSQDHHFTFTKSEQLSSELHHSTTTESEQLYPELVVTMSHLGMDRSDSNSLNSDSDSASITNTSQPELAPHISTDTTVKDASDRSLTTMALQTTDALNRTFTDLKSKSEDVRLRASYDLYGLVATASRGMFHSSL